MTVRGSYSYGYGAMFGIGRNQSFRLSKHAGILVTGTHTVLDGVEVYQQAFCQGIFMQSPADHTLIKNSLVEGVVRPPTICMPKRILIRCPTNTITRCPLALSAVETNRERPFPGTICSRLPKTAFGFIEMVGASGARIQRSRRPAVELGPT